MLYDRSFLVIRFMDSRWFPGASDGKESVHEGDTGLIPVLGRSPGEGNGYPCQFSCLAGYSPRHCNESDPTERPALLRIVYSVYMPSRFPAPSLPPTPSRDNHTECTLKDCPFSKFLPHDVLSRGGCLRSHLDEPGGRYSK